MIPQPPPGQGPIDPRGAFSPPPPPGLPQESAGQSGSAPTDSTSPGANALPAGFNAPPAMSPGSGPMPAGMPNAPPPGAYPPSGMYPPPGYGPPPMMMFPPPGAYMPRRSGWRIFFTILSIILLAGSLLLNLILFVGGSGFGISSPGINQTVIQEGDSKQKIAVVPVSGLINDYACDRFYAMMALVEKDSNVRAVVLDVDTPGGTVTASDKIYARIKQFQARNKRENKTVPVIVSMGGYATSGGYYVSCAGEYIFAQRTTITGNIGVIWPRLNFAKLANSYGVSEETITAPSKGFKNAGSTFHELTSEEREYLQGLLNEALKNFKAAIVGGRPALAKTIDQIADGKALTAAEALKLGLVDQIGYPRDAYDHAANVAALNRPHIVRYSKPATLLDLLGGQAEGKMEGAGAQIGAQGVNVKIDASLLDELNRPRILYLWRGQ